MKLPDELTTQDALPLFYRLLKKNVVEITAHSDDNAYLIFETMNHRGLNLSPQKCLKAMCYQGLQNKKQRNEINSIWKKKFKTARV
jgi:uncharacterized protein with ParB-like and HNH nuclease domain